MTARFPGQKYSSVADYASAMTKALASVRPGEIDRASAALKQAIRDDRLVFACGNGGSAAIANENTISASGDSEYIVRALAWARDNGMATVAMSGFAGGRSAPMADISLHVAAENYGVVEDSHQSLMHILAQYLRMSELPAERVRSIQF